MKQPINDFIEKNYKDIINMARKIVRDQHYEEVAHYVIEQFLTNKKAIELIEKGEAMKYLSGMIHNSYHSSTSPFIRLHKPHISMQEIYNETNIDIENILIDQSDYDYEIDKLLEKIESILNDKHDIEIWFNLTLLKLYVEVPNYVKLAERVKIPRTTISIAVKQAIKYIKEKI